MIYYNQLAVQSLIMVPPRGACTKALAALPDSIGKEGIGVWAFA